MPIDKQARIKEEADRLSARFVQAGGVSVEVASLQPAHMLLDLYGEDIRARAYVTHDDARGEQMLRPDFTMPVVQMHMTHGAEPARYTYNGPIWRKPQPGSDRASEYLQVGYEVFDRADPAAADAEVFGLFADVLAPLNLRAATGDMGILRAAVLGLTTIERRKTALLRHLWRPQRFKQLLDRFGGVLDVPKERRKLLAAAKQTDAGDLGKKAGVHIGLRSMDDVAARVHALQEDAVAPDISSEELAVLFEISNLSGKSDTAAARLKDLANTLPAIASAVSRMERRLAALDAKGIDVSALDFEASYGRTTLEYYDGFVFGFYADGRRDLPVIASGGRYDALTKVLGQGRSIPAVGGVIRPEFSLAVREAAQ